MDKIDKIVKEEIDSYISSNMIFEYAMKPFRMMDKYGEVVGAIVDNLVAICLYPDNPAVPHWRERAYGLCKRFVDIDLIPDRKNTTEYRMKTLSKSLTEVLNEDYSSILNHFKTVSEYYQNRPNPHERLILDKPYSEYYIENKERIENGIVRLTEYVASQDYAGMIQFMNDF